MTHSDDGASVAVMYSSTYLHCCITSMLVISHEGSRVVGGGTDNTLDDWMIIMLYRNLLTSMELLMATLVVEDVLKHAVAACC